MTSLKIITKDEDYPRIGLAMYVLQAELGAMIGSYTQEAVS